MEEVERYKNAIESALKSLGMSGNGDCALYANLYNALYPKPQYKEIEKVYYLLVDEAGVTLATNSKPFRQELPKSMTEVKAVGIFKQKVARKVKKRVRLDTVGACFPETAQFFAEWYEDEA